MAELRRQFAGDIRLDRAARVLYSTDASIYQIEPLGVAIPRTQDDLHAAVELAAKYRVPVLARGAGSSLAGQAIGDALILDCSRWLDEILEIRPAERLAVVEPGVGLSSLNRAVGVHGLQFGPDPASAERATMGGVISNNATGAHSILYGMTADHLRSADVLLSDGSRATLGIIRGGLRQQEPGRNAHLDHAGPAEGSLMRYQAIVRAAMQIRDQYAGAIKAISPRSWRNSAGYRLNYLLPWSPAAPPEWTGGQYPGNLESGELNLAHILAGSEGTLAIIRRATVSLVPKPKHTVLGIIRYSDVSEACEAVPAILKHGPSAVELIPEMILRLAQNVPAYARQLSWMLGTPAAILVVEFSGDHVAALREAAGSLGSEVMVVEDSESQAQIWNVRKVGLGILDLRPQSARPVAFIEDCAIPVERLAEFVRGIERIMAEHGTTGGIYGHASAGCLHIRPILDLKSAQGARHLREIAEGCLDLTLQLGGSMSSEHGDGIARGEWLRRTYGDTLVEAMRLLKTAADPDGVLSPQKMLDAPAMDSNLRYGPNYRARGWTPGMDFRANGGLTMAIEQCNGQGVCRKDNGVMCPSFQATRDEMHSTRGRANLLRALIIGSEQARSPATAAGREGRRSAVRGELSSAVFEALDLCVACKGCKAECPSGVDMAKLKSAFLAEYYSTRSRPLRDFAFGYFHVTAALLSAAAPVTNALGKLSVFRQSVVRSLGITMERPMPRFAFRRARPRVRPGGTPVLYLPDPFTHYVEIQVEQAAFDLLWAAGYDVRVLRTMGAGASLIAKGFLAGARRHAQALLEELRRRDADGALAIVGIEPSELSALRYDYRDLLLELDPAGETRFDKCQSVAEFLVKAGYTPQLRIATMKQRIHLHPHCHENAGEASTGQESIEVKASSNLLRACGHEVDIIDAGCCGMAGTFGYEAEHYMLSQKIGGLRLFPRIRELGGELVVANGAACRMQISQATHAAVEHPFVIAARAVQLA